MKYCIPGFLVLKKINFIYYFKQYSLIFYLWHVSTADVKGISLSEKKCTEKYAFTAKDHN